MPSLGGAFQKDFKEEACDATGGMDISDHIAVDGLNEFFEVDCKLLITGETFALHNRLVA